MPRKTKVTPLETAPVARSKPVAKQNVLLGEILLGNEAVDKLASTPTSILAVEPAVAPPTPALKSEPPYTPAPKPITKSKKVAPPPPPPTPIITKTQKKRLSDLEPSEYDNLVKSLRIPGMPASHIAKKFGMSPYTVKSIAKREQITSTRAARKPKAQERQPVPQL